MQKIYKGAYIWVKQDVYKRQVLGEVKGEFEKFYSVLETAQKRITQTGDELDKLIGVRMRAMERKLRSVEKSENNSFDDML